MSDTVKKPSLYKKRLIAVLVILAAFVILALLNTIDFTPTPAETEAEVYTPTTYSEEEFYGPPTESIENDPLYQQMDSIVYYSDGSEIISLLTEPSDLDAKIFYCYFEALKKGDHEALNALHNEVFFRNHDPYTHFTEQRVYDISVIAASAPQEITLADSKEDEKYIGATLTRFEVRYKIFRNDGTFRRDILYDDVILQVFYLLTEKNGDRSISSIRYQNHVKPSEESADILPFLMPLIWAGLFIILLVLWLIIKRFPLLTGSLAAFIAFLVSVKFSLIWQIIAFLLCTALLLVFFFIRKQRHHTVT